MPFSFSLLLCVFCCRPVECSGRCRNSHISTPFHSFLRHLRHTQIQFNLIRLISLRITMSHSDLGSSMLDIGSSAAAASSSSSSSSSVLSCLSSLPPRAQKRRRGARFKANEKEEEEEEQTENKGEQTKTTQQRTMRERKFEYLDHTADIQLHSWGSTLIEALEQNVLAMFGYITDTTKVDIDPERTDTFEVKAHDIESLVFTLLDEFLYRFATNEWIPCDVRIQSLDLDQFTIRVTGYGERFTLAKHPQGTEIKAITYSNMQIYVDGKRMRGDNDEITKRTRCDTDNNGNEPQSEEAEMNQMPANDADEGDEEEDYAPQQTEVHGADVYVIVDI